MELPVVFSGKAKRCSVSATSIQCLHECRRKYLFRHKYGLSLRGEYIAPLTIGKMFHALGADRLSGKSWEDTLDGIQHRIGLKLDEERAKSDPMFDEKLLRTGLERDLEIAQCMVRIHEQVAEVTAERFEVLPEFTERKVKLKVSWLDNPLSVVIDNVIRNKANGETWIRDFKTISKSPINLAKTALWHIQPRIYRLVAGLEWPDLKLTGFVHDVIQKPGIRLCGADVKAANAQGITAFEAYMARVRDWYHDQKDSPFLCSWLRFSGEPLDDELGCILGDADDAAGHEFNGQEVEPQAATYYRDPSGRACLGPYGNSPCTFIDLCATATSGWDPILERFTFKEETNENDQQEMSDL